MSERVNRGRGHRGKNGSDEGRGGNFESIVQTPGSGPAKSVEGWIIFITNLHPEAQEDDILDKFSDFGNVKNISVNLDRRTGFIKGYALIEFETFQEAEEAIKSMDGQDLLGQNINVAWAFSK